MPTASYAVLGATGNTGSALVQNLLRSPVSHINAYCRNKLKLLRLLPELSEAQNVTVYEGSIIELSLITACIRNTHAVFLAVTSNDNIPGCRLSQDSVQTVLSALQQIRTEDAMARMPKLVLLSSATLDSHLSHAMPSWFLPIMKTAASNVYTDLIKAEQMLRANESWVTSIFIKPAGLSVDVQRGHRLTFDEQESFISYLDLAAAMLEAADETDGRYDGRNVSVVNTGGKARFPLGTPICIVVGLLRHFFPGLHEYLPTTGPALV
ncbi:oxidoreductase tpcG [Aspergillus mulundensis]|uniref:Monooxygenase mdpK n=1 Tax=Aspergillus mulundensis TaxID=1810919 RepID=A0A3D8QM83_9EURO|nr:Monooxygenase mdpK [Aspergillus mulundensis]RDW62909.1 Monooxygenase mdpK [Aspergillus mulundensis]